ncbi:hypothetical protein Lser_V15G26239 [Lactuca serriola]
MAKHDDINSNSMENQDGACVIIDLIENAMPPPSSSAKIRRVPEILLREEGDYEKYYVPKVVSIGPYHYGNPKFESVEKLKPVFTKQLLSRLDYNVGLRNLYKKLGEANMVKELREFYEEESTDHLNDEEFTKMMLLDGCFILYYIRFIYGERAENCSYLRSHQTVLINQDLFSLENQIPFKVLNEVMDLIKLDRLDKFQSFFVDNILSPRMQKRVWFQFFNLGSRSTQTDQNYAPESHGSYIFIGDHLLHRLHTGLKGISAQNESHTIVHSNRNDEISTRCTFRNVSELVDVGIHFKPSSRMSLDTVEFVELWWWWFSAYLKLPPITVDDSTKLMILNLIAYEMCSDDAHAWVTSYICLLDSLIDHPEDVKALRNAGVLDNSLGSDQEVATLFNEIANGRGLVPNNVAYSKVMYQIQKHYEDLRNTWCSQLKHEYIKSPWSFLALVGAVMALFLSAVQTYYTVWSPKGQ